MITDPYYNLHAFTPVLETGCLSPDELMAGLLERMRTYHPSDDLSMIEKAYETASKAHEGQMRKSGDPYIVHPLWVCIILASLEMDRETIMAAMLHDVVEDTAYNEDSIREAFGDDVARLVDGVTKLGQIDYSSDRLEAQAQNLRKMFLAMAKDIRVIVIKLADRLHNMWTLQYMKPEKQIEKAEETLDIYAPIAGRLGIYKIQSELEDTSLKFLKPDVYNSIIEQLEEYHSQRDKFINKTVGDVAKHMEEAHIKAEVFGRVKHVFSIYRKMVQQDKTSIDEIYDIFATRIIVETVQDCYAALGTIHDLYTPVPGRFKDYIAMPKPNMYRSLHTTLIGEEGKPFEVQIRTKEMHRIAEYGIAAHWQYKESGGSDEQASESGEDAKLTWLRRILEWQQDTSDNKEFLSTVKGDLDLFAGDVYCFTPQGDVKTLP
ncbi:MAG: bifunctional (p)ppGpp synthetase/guanosine-3',5'-bis(diphosphate) 3'-pyrophosphohydrolase, partial [Lachnospiraceae bacterium]|nr:bifunctional (p)ppGpp synthetase/guanosine-3',5'-bis(diphosphate) 3'-pyrophosphohydrolase [Lachnospiraceae bacterium]